MYEINKGVPVPPFAVHRNTKYPFRSMEIGDSFFVPDIQHHNMSSVMAYHKKAYGTQFTARQEDNGIRVWRIK